jgi:hypothetical protein
MTPHQTKYTARMRYHPHTVRPPNTRGVHKSAFLSSHRAWPGYSTSNRADGKKKKKDTRTGPRSSAVRHANATRDQCHIDFASGWCVLLSPLLPSLLFVVFFPIFSHHGNFWAVLSNLSDLLIGTLLRLVHHSVTPHGPAGGRASADPLAPATTLGTCTTLNLQGRINI